MCGIAGVINLDGRPARPDLLTTMLNALKHRGPDQQGTYFSEHVSIGMRRLKIIALDNGEQPSYSNNGQYVLVFNGEIYNYLSLRAELMAKGFNFATDSDAEVIVNMYQLYGDGFYDRLDGMFALAIYDRKNDTLFLARDPAGKKPLFYSVNSGSITFASELNSLLQNNAIPRDVDYFCVDYYLRYRVVPSDRCIFSAVSKVPAGGAVTFKSGKEIKSRYWQVSYQPVDDQKTLHQSVDELDDLLNQAVAKRLSAEVQVGTMLSGGLDSSLITAIACKQGHVGLKTFAVGFNEAAFSELDFSRRLAKDFGTDHHDLIITPQKAFHAADQLVKNFGEPFAFPSSIASYFMYKLAREHVSVVLGGDGADELFGGYARYSLIADFPILPTADNLPRKVDIFNKEWKSDQFAQFYQALLTDGASSDLRKQLYSNKMVSKLNESSAALAYDYGDELNCNLDYLSVAMQYDFNHWMREAQLVKIDIASMANSLEVRVPFLDKLIIQYATSLPGNLKIHLGKEKYLLNCLAKRYLPDYIINRKKQELAVPLEQWMVASMRQKVMGTLTSDRALSRGYFDPDKMREFVGGFDGKQSYPLWTMYILEKWHEVFVDGED
ncbi:asparagine synthase (glutamine-hydrolyzing) [Pseudomonas syringae group genomosp. 3]|uniref:asparagine synthase (glutamine-hydrolyzing) n=1 Tax=Pseudomonas syringae pv. primulae TaxID=251707 RepID=A0A3M3XBP3_9PSED|nr:asparagine synthase (glutamine-hydrolyzing) [Pseudomonas syringae group genomosp. 3]RMO67375.1 Asparagine synthetase [Pseudomonas syringae pv. primulae]RMU34011.1 hypothetical protein ALP30_200053 [Pseudomonas syringae pv. primulae]